MKTQSFGKKSSCVHSNPDRTVKQTEANKREARSGSGEQMANLHYPSGSRKVSDGLVHLIDHESQRVLDVLLVIGNH